MIKNLFKSLILKNNLFRKPSISYCVKNNLFPEIITRTSSYELKKLLFLPESKHRTQLNQDIFALLANRFIPGYFLEIGANDGFTLSNTQYLEKSFGWNGLLIEANPKYRESLQMRSATSIITAITENEGEYLFCDAGLYGGLIDNLSSTHQNITNKSENINVRGTTLQSVLNAQKAPPIINFVSIDVEGAEAQIVDQLCKLPDHRFVCGCIEHNYRSEDYIRIVNCLNDADYQVIWSGQTSHDLFFIDKRLMDSIGFSATEKDSLEI